uniref:Mpv17-like protein n=1 Tax=Panagrellus redivivus TaxID=6233 RepID=A0A7E4VXG7_PANRE
MCIIFGTADAFVQSVQNRETATSAEKNSIDWKRVLRVSAIGILHGPMNHFWYRFLDGVAFRGRPGYVIAKKVIADLSVSPVFATSFIAGLSLLEGNSIKNALLEYKQKFVKLFTLDACVWPPAQAINFWFVPPAFRVLYVSTVIFVYTGIFTAMRHDDAIFDEKTQGL